MVNAQSKTNIVTLWVDVPMSGYRPMWAREYQETYPVPAPSTIYGMLLSLVGVERPDKADYAGLRIAIALSEDEGTFWHEREKGRIFRKFRRIGQSKKEADLLADRRPDYQELLLGLQMWLWVDDSKANNPLCGKIRNALDPVQRRCIKRHGALCLGESSHMVNEITVKEPNGRGRFVNPDIDGFLSMPVWSDHDNDQPNICTFEISESQELPVNLSDDCWIPLIPKSSPE